MNSHTISAFMGIKLQLYSEKRKEFLDIPAAAQNTASPNRQAAVADASVTPTLVQWRHSEQYLGKAPAHQHQTDLTTH